MLGEMLALLFGAVAYYGFFLYKPSVGALYGWSYVFSEIFIGISLCVGFPSSGASQQAWQMGSLIGAFFHPEITDKTALIRVGLSSEYILSCALYLFVLRGFARWVAQGLPAAVLNQVRALLLRLRRP